MHALYIISSFTGDPFPDCVVGGCGVVGCGVVGCGVVGCGVVGCGVVGCGAAIGKHRSIRSVMALLWSGSKVTLVATMAAAAMQSVLDAQQAEGMSAHPGFSKATRGRHFIRSAPLSPRERKSTKLLSMEVS